MRRFSPREMRRMMDRIGVNTREMPDIREVIFRTATKDLIVQNPSVTSVEIQGQQIFQVVGDGITERQISAKAEPEKAKPSISEEDILLVAQQADVTMEEAKATLEEVEGNLAQAILILTSKKK
ncbi:MAG: nascent polypeptide-associated complex protein [Candidatus Bathyarchaeia archaeon]